MAEAVIASFPPFRPRAPWWGPDLQTLRNTLRPPVDGLAAWPAETLEFRPDESGDTLIGRYHQPTAATNRPLVIVIHGLTGSENSAYIRVTAETLLKRGFPVLRMNVRGAGPSRPLCKRQAHAGKCEDFAAVLNQLPAALTRHGVAAIGYSMGGAMLLKHLGDTGADSGLIQAASVCAPINLVTVSRRLGHWRNRPYHGYLLSEMKREFLATPDLDPSLAATARALTRIVDFDEAIVAPLNGFASALDYQTRCSSAPGIGAIRTRTLAIHAADDPWIPVADYHAADWQAGNARLLLANGGGHVGFHGASGTWHDDCLVRFLEAGA